MIDKHYDDVIIGSGYLSSLLGLVWSKQGRKVLVLEDERITDYSFSNCLLSNLEVFWIRQSLGDLISLDTFLSPVRYELKLEHGRVLLGGDFKENLREFARKSYLFDKNAWLLLGELFNRDDLIGEMSSEINDIKNRDDVRRFFKKSDIFQKFFSQYKDLRNDKTFDEISRAIYPLLGIKIQNFLNEKSLQYFLYRLLSPAYLLDAKSFHEAMKGVLHQERIGHKESRIKEIEIYKGKIENIVLDSFEGVITPKKLWINGGISADFPLQFKNKREWFTMFSVAGDKLPNLEVNCSSKWQGMSLKVDGHIKNIPHLLLELEKGEIISWNGFYRNAAGTKLNFWQSKIETLIQENWPKANNLIYREKRVFLPVFSGIKGARQLVLQEDALINRSVSNICFLGQAEDNSFGLRGIMDQY